MVEAKAEVMSELRYASEFPDQEMFSGLSPSHSPKNLLPTVICCTSQMVTRVQLPQALQMQSEGSPLNRLHCTRKRELHRSRADSVSSLPQLDTSWSGDCSDPFISLESPVLSLFPITIKPSIGEEHRICGVSSERVSLAGTPTTGIYSSGNSHLPF